MKRPIGPLLLLLGLLPWGPLTAETAPICKPGSVTLEPELRFGAEDEDEAGFLFRPIAVVVDNSGNLFVLDHAQQSIIKFDKEGRHLRTFGREGEGPGELRNAHQLAITPKDHIVTYDLGNRRVTFFDNDGEYLRSVDTTRMGTRFPLGIRVVGDESIFMEIHEIDFSSKSEDTVTSLTRFSRDMENETVIDELSVRDNIMISRPVRTNVPVPFPPGMHWDLGPSGDIVVGHSGDYTLKFFAEKGELQRSVRHEGKSEKVTEEDQEEHFAGISTTVGGHVSQGAPEYVRNVTKFPRYKPHFRGLRVDAGGNVLVWTYRSENKKSVYDIFDSDGTFLCSTALPAILDSAVGSGRYLYRIVDDDDPPYVQRYGLSGPISF